MPEEGSRSAARLLRFSRRALEALENDKPHRKHLRDRAAQDHPIEGVPLEQDRARHGIQAGRGRTEEWRRLDGHNQLPKIIQGVKFIDGLEVAAKPADPQAQTAAA